MIVVDFEMESYEVDEGNNVTVCVQLVDGCLQRDAEVQIVSIVSMNGAVGKNRCCFFQTYITYRCIYSLYRWWSRF